MFERTSSNQILVVHGSMHLVYLSNIVSLHHAPVMSGLHGPQNSVSVGVGLSEIVPSSRTQRDWWFVQAESNMMSKAGNEWWCAYHIYIYI